MKIKLGEFYRFIPNDNLRNKKIEPDPCFVRLFALVEHKGKLKFRDTFWSYWYKDEGWQHDLRGKLLDFEWIKENGGRERAILILSDLDSNDKHYEEKVKLISDMIKTPNVAYLCPKCLLEWCKSVGIKVKNSTEDKGSWWTASVN